MDNSLKIIEITIVFLDRNIYPFGMILFRQPEYRVKETGSKILLVDHCG